MEGPISALFIVEDLAAQEIDGLLARFDIESTAYLYRRTHANRAFDVEDRRGGLPRDLDVIVLSALTPSALPKWLGEAIEVHLREGTGVVLLTESARGLQDSSPSLPDSPDAFYDDSRLMWLADASGIPRPTRSTDASGSRQVVLPWLHGSSPIGGLLPHAPADALNAPSSLEDYYSILGRAIFWAANASATPQITGLDDLSPEGPDPASTPPQLPRRFVERMRRPSGSEGGHRFVMRLDRPAPRGLEVRVQVRHPYRGVRWEYTLDDRMRKGATSMEFTLPVGIGPSYVDVWLLNRERVVDWHTEAFDFPGWPAISEVELPPAYAAPNDRLRASLTVEPDFYRQRAAGLQPRAAGVIARSVDPLGRVVGELHQTADPDGGSVTIEMPLVDLVSPYIRFEVCAVPQATSELNWWTLERSVYTASHSIVRTPWPTSMALVADLPGDGSFSARAQRIRARTLGVSVAHAMEPEPAWGSVAADGLIPLGSLALDSVSDCGSVDINGVATRRLTEWLRPFGNNAFLLHADTEPCVEEVREAIRGRFESLDTFNSTQMTDSTSWTMAANRVALGATPDAASIRSEIVAKRALATRQAIVERVSDVTESTTLAIVSSDVAASRLILASSAAPSTVHVDRLSLALVRSQGPSPDDRRFLQALVPREGRGDAWCRWVPWAAAAYGFASVWLAADEPGTYPIDLLEQVETLQSFINAYDQISAGYDALWAEARTAPAAALILLSPHDLLDVSDVSSTLAAWEAALSRMGIAYDVAFADRVSQRELKTYSCVIVPQSASIPAELDSVLGKFGQAGGSVISDRDMAWSTVRVVESSLDQDVSRKERDRIRALLNNAAGNPDGLNAEASSGFSGSSWKRRLGDAELILFLQHFDAEDDTTVEVSHGDRAVYAPMVAPGDPDRSQRIELAPGEPALFCTLPYEVSRIVLDVPERANPGSRLAFSCVVRTIGELPGDHVLQVQLFDPAGVELRHYRRTIVAESGRAEGYLPLAYNESEGTHTLRATDLMSGIVTEIEVEIR